MDRAVGRSIRRLATEQGLHVRHLAALAALASELRQRQTGPYQLPNVHSPAGQLRRRVSSVRRARPAHDRRPEAAKSFAVKTVDRMPERMERCRVGRDPNHSRHV
jgi:hypothetical protein